MEMICNVNASSSSSTTTTLSLSSSSTTSQQQYQSSSGGVGGETAAATETRVVEYCEPNYPITKTEEFDEDIMKKLLIDDKFSKSDLQRLSAYAKQRRTGGTVMVKYQLASNVSIHGLGRLYPQDGIGLQTYANVIRNPLTSEKYWDIDIENCHYHIACKYCAQYDIPYQHMKQYATNRNEMLTMVSDSRSKAKTEFLKILYGGNIKLFAEEYDEQDGNITNEGLVFLTKLKSEVGLLMEKIWVNHAEYQPTITSIIKEKKRKGMGDRNPKATMMSIIFQTDERKILMFIDTLLRDKYHREFAILIHDGGFVRKREGETQFPPMDLEYLSTQSSTKFKMSVNLTQKPIVHFWVPKVLSFHPYDIMKREFEVNNCMVGSKIINIDSEDIITHNSVFDTAIKLRNKHYMEPNAKGHMVKKFFFTTWQEDVHRRQYDKADFIPDTTKCPKSVFNLFRGFEAVKNEPPCIIYDDELESLMEPIIQHLDMLSSGNSNWMLRWMSSIIHKPMMKTEIAVLIRDMGGLFTEGGGNGKNKFFEEFFGEKILGKDLYYIIGSNVELYSVFNSQFEGKLFVMVEETKGSDNHMNNDILKSKITSKKLNVNKKCIASYQVRDFTNYLFTTNNVNPLPIKSGSRRYAVFDTTPTFRGDIQYFTNLHHYLMEDPRIPYVFYRYLLNYIEPFESPIEAQNSIPITYAYREMRLLNAPTYIKWIIYLLDQGMLYNGYISDLYDLYRTWSKKWNEAKEETMISMTAFGRLLCCPFNDEIHLNEEEKDIMFVDKHKKHGKSYITWDIEKVVKSLKKTFLLPEDYEYIPHVNEEFGCLITPTPTTTAEHINETGRGVIRPRDECDNDDNDDDAAADTEVEQDFNELINQRRLKQPKPNNTIKKYMTM